jgi:hypothetical protein
MNEDIRQRRRQAAWLCFEPHLDEDRLVQAIELLEQRFQIEGMNILISYITTVCTEFNIHKDIGKSLCVKFFELMAHKNIVLPRDPLPLVEEKRLSAIRERTSKEVKEEVPAASTSTSSANIPPIEEMAAHNVIFICFLKHILKESFSNHQTLIDLLKLCCAQDKKITRSVRIAVDIWNDNPQSFRWVLALDEKKSAEFTHLLYLCVCEISGPVEADQLFHKTIALCEQRPEARKFAPSRLL